MLHVCDAFKHTHTRAHNVCNVAISGHRSDLSHSILSQHISKPAVVGVCGGSVGWLWEMKVNSPASSSLSICHCGAFQIHYSMDLHTKVLQSKGF